MSELKEITEALVEFRNKRDWEQFHNSKDLSLAIMLESAELNELFLWKDKDEINDVPVDRIKEELADILAFSILLGKTGESEHLISEQSEHLKPE